MLQSRGLGLLGQWVVLEADIAGLAPFTPLLKVQPGFFIVPRKQAAETVHREAHGLMDAHGDEEITEVKEGS